MPSQQQTTIPANYPQPSRVTNIEQYLELAKRTFNSAAVEIFKYSEAKNQNIRKFVRGVKLLKDVLDCASDNITRELVTVSLTNGGVKLSTRELEFDQHITMESIAARKITTTPRYSLLACFTCCGINTKNIIESAEVDAQIELTSLYIGALLHLYSSMAPHRNRVVNPAVTFQSIEKALGISIVILDGDHFEIKNMRFDSQQSGLKTYLSGKRIRRHLMGNVELLTRFANEAADIIAQLPDKAATFQLSF